MTSTINLERLKDPFPAADIEWRVARAGRGEKGVWAQVLAYVTNRAIMDRLDEVCGQGGWWNEFRPWANNAQLCGIALAVTDEGHCIVKWDGAQNTEIEPVKGGLSDSMKRAAVQWGIGRYLYHLETGWAEILPDRKSGSRRDKFKNKETGKDEWFHWLPPSLPEWALPATANGPEKPATARKPVTGPTLAPDTQPDSKIDTKAYDAAKAYLHKHRDDAKMLLRCILRLPAAKGMTKGQKDLLAIEADAILLEHNTYSEAFVAFSKLSLDAGPGTQLTTHLQALQKEHDWK